MKRYDYLLLIGRVITVVFLLSQIYKETGAATTGLLAYIAYVIELLIYKVLYKRR